MVREMAVSPHRSIAAVIGVSVSTLRKAFADELAASKGPGLFEAAPQRAPVRAARPPKGRPKTAANPEHARQVEQYVALGMSAAEIARAMGVSDPTLRKLYGEQLAVGPARTKAVLIDALMKAVRKGNVSALREGLRLADQASLDRLQQAAIGAGAPVREDQPGKKAQAQIDAMTALEDGEWGSLIRPH